MEPQINCPVRKPPPPPPPKKKKKKNSILSHVNLVHDLPPYFYKMYCNIILPYSLRSCKWSLPSRFQRQKRVSISTPYLLASSSSFCFIWHPSNERISGEDKLVLDWFTVLVYRVIRTSLDVTVSSLFRVVLGEWSFMWGLTKDRRIVKNGEVGAAKFMT